MFYNAKELRGFGKKLIGRRIITEEIGNWTGGECQVLELDPDPAAPEIVFRVRRISDGEEIGVFDYETVDLLPEDDDTSPDRREIRSH